MEGEKRQTFLAEGNQHWGVSGGLKGWSDATPHRQNIIRDLERKVGELDEKHFEEIRKGRKRIGGYGDLANHA